MQSHIKNMEALLHSKEISVPLMKKEGQQPEQTPQADEPELDLLDQINFIEKKEKKSMLEKSMKPGGFGNALFNSMQEPNQRTGTLTQSQMPGFSKKNKKKKDQPQEPPKSPRTQKKEADKLQ